MNESYRKGFADGYRTAYDEYASIPSSEAGKFFAEELREAMPRKKPSVRKRKQSPKQKLLTEMTAKKWRTYSKGRGRKTYVQIRAEVARSQAFKRRAKKL